MAARVVVIADDGRQIEISDPDPEDGSVCWDCPDGEGGWHDGGIRPTLRDAIEDATTHADYRHGKG